MNSHWSSQHSSLINPACMFKVHQCAWGKQRQLIPPSPFPIRHSHLKPHSANMANEIYDMFMRNLALPFICSNLTLSCNIHQRAVALSCEPRVPHNPLFCSQSDYFLSSFYPPPTFCLTLRILCPALFVNDAFNLQGHCSSFNHAC